MQGYYRKIIPFSSVDGPGNRSVLFLQGCNFNCLYCHNPETIEFSTKENVVEGSKLISAKELVDELLEHEVFIKGVTISGGECTSQYLFLLEICRELKEKNIEVFIDTNAYLSHEKFIELSKYVDKYMIDIKSIDEKEHLMLTGKSIELVIKNTLYALGSNKVFEIRTVVVPKILNNYRTVQKVSRMIAIYSVRYKLIKFRNKGTNDGLYNVKSPSDEYMDDLYKVASSNNVKDILIV